MSHALQWSSDTITLQRLICNDIVSLLHFLCSHHPLYLAYFIFFSPYLLSLVFFLSPLLLSTSVFLLLTLVIFSSTPFPELPCTSLIAILELLKWKTQACTADSDLVDQLLSMILDSPVYCSKVTLENTSKDKIVVDNESVGDQEEMKRSSDMEVISADDESFSSSSSSVYLSLASESPLKDENLSENYSENISWSSTRRRNSSLWSSEGSSILMGNYLRRDGSMRREKEWKRTLACKLYEERMTSKLCEERKVAEGCQEMDLLWEAYEVDALKLDKTDNKIKKKKEKNREFEEENEEESAAEVCCLQALRLSAGKMNLRVGKPPNLMKFSKALTGIGLLQRIGSRRRSRKG